MKGNRLKQRLIRGQCTSGCWLFSGSTASAEILAHCGFDALLIDHEHSPGGLETMIDQLRAIEKTEATPLVRLAELSDSRVKLALDSGASGLLVANVETAAQVRELRAAASYPPDGRRGAHFTVSRAARWGIDSDDYYRSAREETLLIAMIESADGVAAIPEMVREGAVEMFFIGPLDLSASIGAMGRYDDAAFLELLGEAERRIFEAGVWLGGATMPGHDLTALFGRGYRFASFTSDVAILRDTGMALAQDGAQAALTQSEGRT